MQRGQVEEHGMSLEEPVTRAGEGHRWEERDLLLNFTRWTVRELLRDSSVEEYSKQICFYILSGWFIVEVNWLFLMRLTLYICKKEFSKIKFLKSVIIAKAH